MAKSKPAPPGPTAAGVQAKSPKPPTAFQSRVYAACSLIPAGRVSTYGAMAEALGSAPRAVGQALRCNPFAPAVPCHRVIASTLELGGFTGAGRGAGGSWDAGCASVKKKRALLESEGVLFTSEGKLRDTRALMDAIELKKLMAAKDRV